MSAVAALKPDDRADFYARLKPGSLAPLWEVMKGLVPAEPKSKAVPHAWRYTDLRPLLLEAGDLLTAEEAERRVLVLENPALVGQSRVTSSLYAGVQIIMPGEVARAHRHSAGAMRFIIESEGGYTSVAGERTLMQRGDFVVTPSGTWHDHGHEGRAPAIWLDGLDVPIVNFFETGFSAHHDEDAQPVSKPVDDSVRRFGSGLLPLETRSPFGKSSPIFSYSWTRSREALMGIAHAGAPDPHYAHSLRYANPLDGGWVMPTIATWLTHLPAGFETRPLRSTDGQVMIVAEGSVEAKIGDRTFRLEENDIAVVPSWTARTLRASSDAILFCFSDRSIQEKIGLWRDDRAPW